MGRDYVYGQFVDALWNRLRVVEYFKRHPKIAAECLGALDCALGYTNMPHARPKAATNRRLRGGGFTRLPDPQTTTTTGANHRNGNTRPFVWKTAADDIIAKVERGRDTRRKIKTQTDHEQSRGGIATALRHSQKHIGRQGS
ncbi:hypothetical protein A5641_13615 [Mycobacterium sp. 1554424.7]|nr:hypothetical protein A5641_13615 [Mycobacterium sp. 1554424.7]